jgi:hypothetical protein
VLRGVLWVPFQRKKPEPIGVRAQLPAFVEPALATSIAKVPSGSCWIHEIEFDGYRVQIHLANEAVKIFTRRGHDWTHRFKKVSHDAWHIKAASAVIDGEILVPAADGTTGFSVLQNELKVQSRWKPSHFLSGRLTRIKFATRNDHVGSTLCESAHHLQTKPPGATRDQCDLSGRSNNSSVLSFLRHHA